MKNDKYKKEIEITLKWAIESRIMTVTACIRPCKK